MQSSSGINSMNRVVLRGTYYPSKVEGINTSLDKTTWYSETANATSAPQDTDTHAIWWGVRPIDGSTTGAYTVLTTINYHCHFFSPENTVLSLQRQQEELARHESHEDDFSDDGEYTVYPATPIIHDRIEPQSISSNGTRVSIKKAIDLPASKLLKKV